MIRNIGMAAVLAVAVVSTASAQQAAPPPPASQPVGPAAAVPPGTAVVMGTQYAILQADAPQAAPFNPAPLGTHIETTAGKRIVTGVNGYNVTFDVNGRREFSHAFLTDGYNSTKFYPERNLANMWPLEVGKSATFNIDTDGGNRAITARVLRTETITIPAGTYFTYVIERRDRGQDSAENIATSWYAPAIGSVIKFEERLGRPGRVRPAYEMTAIVLPHSMIGVQPVASLAGDSAEARAQFCNERGTAVQLPDQRIVPVSCLTYVTAQWSAYEGWLSAHNAMTRAPSATR